MGFGDVKLMFLLGLRCGIVGLPYVLLLSALLALAFTVASHRQSTHSQTRLPFGPYLCAGCALYMLFSDNILVFLHFRANEIEAARGRPISESIQKSFQRIGLAVILLLMLLGTYNDILRL